jgi:ABC-type dipeptide/oligopeptide/nickel transport system permease component
MSQNAPIERPLSGRPAAGAATLLRETIGLLLTLALSSILVAMIVFAPYAFIGDFSRPAQGWSDYLAAIGNFFAGLARGRLSDSAQNSLVWSNLLTSARRSGELIGVSIAIALPLGIVWGGLLASARQRVARALLFGLNTLVMSLPSFAIMLLSMESVANLTLRTGIQLTYVQGYGIDRHLILPAGVLGLRGAAYLARSFQIAHEDILRQDWIRAARARGFSGVALWRHHVLPALRLPALGIALGMLRVLINGLIMIDYIYGWGGLGRRMLTFDIGSFDTVSNSSADGAALVLVIGFVIIDALGQVSLRYADPRLREVDNA